MEIRSQFRELFYTALVVLLIEGIALAVVFLASGPLTTRRIAAAVGGAVCVVAALISGNPRLFCLWGLGFSVPFLVAQTFGEVINKGGGEVAFNIDVTDLFLIALIGFIARDIYRERRAGIRFPRVSYFWIAVMVMGVAAIISGPYRTAVAQEIFRMAKMLALFLVLCQELETPRRILHWCGAMMSGLIVNSIVAVVQYHYRATLGLADLGEAADDVTRTLAATSVQGTEVWRVGAFLVHPNIFGAFLAAMLPLAVACFLVQRGAIPKLYYSVALVLGVPALLFTQSRSAWIALGAALVLLVALLTGNLDFRPRSFMISIVLVLGFLAVVVLAREQIAARIFSSQEGAVSFRGVFNGDAKRMIADNPLWGVGLNTYVLQLAPYSEFRYGVWPPPVHNIYYMWWAETGTIGLLMHLLMWAGIVWTGIRNLRVRDQCLFAVNAACLAGMSAFALDGFASFSLRVTPTLKTFWVLAAMIMAVRYWRLRYEVNANLPAESPSTSTPSNPPFVYPNPDPA